jgi:hypothetical protein
MARVIGTSGQCVTELASRSKSRSKERRFYKIFRWRCHDNEAGNYTSLEDLSMKRSQRTVRDLFKCLRVILPVFTLNIVVLAAQDGQIVCRQQFKTSNNCYRLYKPADSARGLVVMLPYYGSDANEFSSAALPGLLAKKNVATMVVSASGYLTDDDLVTLRGLVGEVVHELGIPQGSLVVGGISAGGTGAARYSEYCISGHCDARSRPVAIFSVGAPLVPIPQSVFGSRVAVSAPTLPFSSYFCLNRCGQHPSGCPKAKPGSESP